MLIYPPYPPLGSLVDSERVVLRKDLASIIADNNRLEGIDLQRRADLAAKDAENSGLRSETSRLLSLAAAQQEALEGAGIKIKDMERREAYHDNPNVPPSHRSLTLLEMRREDTEERRRSSTGRRPGRARGHPGTTSKLDAGAEREDRHACAAECPECHGTSLHRRRGLPKEVVEIEVTKKEKMIVFHDLVCNGCGYVVKASRRGTAIRRGGSVYGMLCEELGVLPRPSTHRSAPRGRGGRGTGRPRPARGCVAAGGAAAPATAATTMTRPRRAPRGRLRCATSAAACPPRGRLRCAASVAASPSSRPPRGRLRCAASVAASPSSRPPRGRLGSRAATTAPPPPPPLAHTGGRAPAAGPKAKGPGPAAMPSEANGKPRARPGRAGSSGPRRRRRSRRAPPLPPDLPPSPTQRRTAPARLGPGCGSQ